MLEALYRWVLRWRGKSAPIRSGREKTPRFFQAYTPAIYVVAKDSDNNERLLGWVSLN